MNNSFSRLQPFHILLVAVVVVIAFLLLSAALFYADPADEETLARTEATPTTVSLSESSAASPTLAPAQAETFPPTAPPSAGPSVTPSPTAATTATPPGQGVDEATVEALLAQLTLEQKLGQMQMVGLPGTAVNDLTRQRVADMGVGGIIFLERNTTDPQQVRDLTQALQRLAIEEGTGLPLFIGWNHEGGPVVRRRSGVTAFPAAMALGAAGQPELTFAIGQAVAEEMRSLGVNMNFAPVLDVNNEPANPVIGLRSYGAVPERVTQHGEYYIRGQHQGGVIGVAKHFPGHGDVTVDSHVALPVLNSTLDNLQQTELPPFQMAIETGVPAIMVAHIQLPHVDPDGWPASLSHVVVTELLRQELGYDGVVMTDELGMNAIEDNYSLGQAAVQAVLAGNDLLLTVETANHPEIVHNALLQAVQTGRLSEERIDESVQRLIRLKLTFSLADVPSTPPLANQPAHQELARRAGTAAVQVLQDSAGLLPLSLPANLLLISPEEVHPGSAVGDGQSALGERLAAAGATVTELFYNHESPADIADVRSQALIRAETTTAYVIVTWDAMLRYAHYGETAQETLVNALLATGKPVVVIFGQLPYDSERVPGAPVQIATYGDGDGQIEAVVGILLGEGQSTTP